MSLHIENIHAGYGKKEVLTDVSLQIERGCICALMGRNGSGKTTLLRCINAVLKPAQGKVLVLGNDVTKLTRVEIARLISVVPQSCQTAFPFSCREMILMSCVSRLNPWSSPSKREDTKVRLLMEELGIESLADRPFNQLSGGERQLVLLARALFQATPVMLLDEPNAHLDFSNQHAIMKLMRDVVKKRDVTALITLHDPNLTLYYCDKVAMLKDGSVAAYGQSEEIMKDKILQEVLGENIQIEITQTGRRVATPRGPSAKIISKQLTNSEDTDLCDAHTANGTVN